MVPAKLAMKFTNDLTDMQLFFMSVGLRVTNDLTKYRVIVFFSYATQ